MDKYDTQIAELLASEDFSVEVARQWAQSRGLFAFAAPRYDDIKSKSHLFRGCGCLTTIRCHYGIAINRDGQPDYDLTRAIRNDERIPKKINQITPEILEVFAEWQRRLDVELRGESEVENG